MLPLFPKEQTLLSAICTSVCAKGRHEDTMRPRSFVH
jgi:hypothetical protein